MAKTIDFYCSLPSPWTYLAGPRFKTLVQRNSVAINWKPFDVSAAFSLTGQKPVKERPPQIQANRLTDLARWCSFLGMKLNLEPKFFPVDPAPAARMVIGALHTGADVMDLANSYMSAVWAEELNIADPDILISIANKEGFDGTALYGAIESPAVLQNLNDNTQEAIARNVFGTPTWIYENELFWGQDRLDFLGRAIERTI